MGIFDNLLAALGANNKEPIRIPGINKQQPAPVKPASAPAPQISPQTEKPQRVDADTVRPDEIYAPESCSHLRPVVESIVLSEAEAIALGWRFRKKSRKRARIVKYLGTKKDLIIPAQIGEWTINEISAGAFYRADIYNVQIPDTVKKIGKNCFRETSLRSIVIAGTLAKIPENFAFSCQHLTEVSLPYTVEEIGDSAFASCPALSFFQFPTNLKRLGDHAFMRSGLTRFATPNRYLSPGAMNGSAFLETPLEKRYRLIATEKSRDRLSIVLVCSDKRTLRLPPCQVHFGKNAVPNVYGSVRVLYCGQCRTVTFDPGAISYDFNGYNKYPIRKNDLTIVVPPFFGGVPFADFISVCYRDGKKYDYFQSCRNSAHRYSVLLLPTGLFRCEEPQITFEKQQNSPMRFEPDAICVSKLESVSLGWLEGEGKLFHKVCSSLHYVEWVQPTAEPHIFRKLHVYLPPASLIGAYQHDYLLQAFCGRYLWENRKRKYVFFDSSYFRKLFKKQDSKRKRYTHQEQMHLMNHERKKWRKITSEPPRMRQRHRIMLALDVLRSADILFPDKEIYETFLRAHRNYALTLLDELPADYREQAERFYQQRSAE